MNFPSPYFDGLKKGDFIQMGSHFGDIYFEVQSCSEPTGGSDYFFIVVSKYAKYGSQHTTDWFNKSSHIRSVIPAEMAVPVMMKKRLRFKASFGQYDPVYGFAPVGTPLCKKD